MTITVAIISKDREQLLNRCLTSISLQSVLPDQVILVEDISDNKFFDKSRVASFFSENTVIN